MRIRRVPIWLFVSLLVVGLTSAPAHAQPPLLTFSAMLQPGQEVPPILSNNPFGNAFMTFDLADSMLCYSISYTNAGAANLLSGETVAHFHGPARPGVSAAPQFNISPFPSPVGSPKVGCVGPLNATQRTELFNGQWYINIHSNQFGTGEIRGQVLFERPIP